MTFVGTWQWLVISDTDLLKQFEDVLWPDLFCKWAVQQFRSIEVQAEEMKDFASSELMRDAKGETAEFAHDERVGDGA